MVVAPAAGTCDAPGADDTAGDVDEPGTMGVAVGDVGGVDASVVPGSVTVCGGVTRESLPWMVADGVIVGFGDT